jgi:hypothetical protein
LERTKPDQQVQSWTVATDDTRVTFGATKDGQLAIYELANPRVGWNLTGMPSVFPLMGTVTVCGDSRDLKWSFQYAGVDRTDGHKVTLRFACEASELELTSVWHTRQGRGPVRHAMRITNRSGQP